MTLASQARGTKFYLSNIDGLLRQKSGCCNYIGRDTAVCIGRLVMVSDGVIGDIPWEYINLSFIIFCGGSSNRFKYAQLDISTSHHQLHPYEQ